MRYEEATDEVTILHTVNKKKNNNFGRRSNIMASVFSGVSAADFSANSLKITATLACQERLLLCIGHQYFCVTVTVHSLSDLNSFKLRRMFMWFSRCTLHSLNSQSNTTIRAISVIWSIWPKVNKQVFRSIERTSSFGLCLAALEGHGTKQGLLWSQS